MYVTYSHSLHVCALFIRDHVYVCMCSWPAFGWTDRSCHLHSFVKPSHHSQILAWFMYPNAEGTHAAPEGVQPPSGAEIPTAVSAAAEIATRAGSEQRKQHCSVSRGRAVGARSVAKCSKVREAAKDDVGRQLPEARSQGCRHAPRHGSWVSAQSCWLKGMHEEPRDFALWTARKRGARLLVVAKKREEPVGLT